MGFKAVMGSVDNFTVKKLISIPNAESAVQITPWLSVLSNIWND